MIMRGVWENHRSLHGWGNPVKKQVQNYRREAVMRTWRKLGNDWGQVGRQADSIRRELAVYLED